MADSMTTQQIIKHLEGLTPALQGKVLDFTRALLGAHPKGTADKDLLDTNIIIALFAGEVVVQEGMRDTEKVFLASPVIGELYCYNC